MLNQFIQQGRFLKLNSPLKEGELVLTNFSGYEALSNIFKFSLHMLSENKQIMPDKLLHKPVTIQVHPNESEAPRYFHGIISRFYGGSLIGNNRHYFADIQPWLAFLNYSSDCRIFQYMSVPEILIEIFKQFKFHDYDFSGINFDNYKKRDYCVQYQETTLNFIQRLLDEEAIFYFFKHGKDKHTVIFGDKASAFKMCMPHDVQLTTGSEQDNCLRQWQRHYRFYPGKFAQRDYNFETPDTTLHGQQSSQAKLAAAQNYEFFHYPGGHQTGTDGNQRAQNHLEAQEAHYDNIRGESSYINFSPGGKFRLSKAPVSSDNGDYLLTTVLHQASDSSYLLGSTGNQSYANQFTCIPAATTYKPPQSAVKPVIFSAQSAVVVGPPGEEIYTDKYGQVKVQFHWDRKGQKDDHSSCWVRVAQSWAGNRWGALFMPRVNQEVIVQFLDGDPDRPVITGGVYNSDNLPPYQLPLEQTRSGIKTHSTKNGGAQDFNELRFEDRNGNEHIFIQAQKDFEQRIKNDLSIVVDHDHNHSTAHNTNINVGNDISQHIGNNLTINIGNTGLLEATQSLTLKVAGNSILINTQGVFINGIKVRINET